MAPKPRISWRAATVAIAAIVLAGLGATAVAASRGAALFASDDHASHGVPVSQEAQQRADALITATTDALAPYADVAAAEAAGYRWIGDDSGYRHYVQSGYLLDSAVLDPARIESLVYQDQPDGSLRLVSGMYILPPGDELDDAPAIAGASWHIHTNLCWGNDATIVGTNDSGSCPAGSVNAKTPPMLHVWVVDNAQGRFAAIDENGEVTASDADHTH